MTTDTSVKLLEEMLLTAQEAKKPGELQANEVLHRGDKDLPIPVTVAIITGDEKVKVYDTRTGDESIILRYMLPAQLQKLRPDGSRFFTTVEPAIKARRGKLPCMLHPSNPARQHYDELGLAVCPKANLTSQYQVQRHMQVKHKVEWATIEQERITKERTEDREFQRQLMTKAVPEKAPLYVKDKQK